MHKIWLILAVTASTGVFSGCASTERPLMPTPGIYRDPGSQDLFKDIPAARRLPAVELLYMGSARDTCNFLSLRFFGEDRQ